MESRIAIASRVKTSDGKYIWIPPGGKPYWIEHPNAGRNLTDEEIQKYLGRPIIDE